MAVAQRPPRSANAPDEQSASEQPSENGASEAQPKRKRGPAANHYLSITISAEQAEKLREMARASGAKSRDFYKALILPTLESAIANFNSNRDVVVARAKAAAAANAAARAAEVARKAQEELASIEANKQ